MPLLIIPAAFFHSPDNIRLGRFVTRMDRPFETKHDPPIVAGPKYIATDFSTAGHSQNGNQTGFAAAVASLISTNISSGSESTIEIAPSRGTNYALEDSDAWFDQAISMEETKRWVEKIIGNDDKIYVIVGMQTLIDPHIFMTSTQNRQAGGGFKVPLGLSLISGGALSPVAGLVDSSIRGDHQAMDNNRQEFLVPGERLYSLEYRKVEFRWIFGRSVDRSRLGEPRYWSCLEGTKRGVDEDDSEGEDEKEDIKDSEDAIEVFFETVDSIDENWHQDNIVGGRICVRSLA